MTVALPPSVDIRGVTRAYPGTLALDSVSLALRSGRITCLLGPSGCGKSSLLRVVAGLEPVDSGEIEGGGRRLSAPGFTVPPEGRNIGLVFQDLALFPHLTVAQNVAFGLDRLDRPARRARVSELLARFKLAHRADAWPHTLSGGEQQRVAIARALAREPAALLLDEPFSGLDGDLKAEVRQVVLSGLRAARAAILIVTHDPEEAMLVADDLALMSAGRLLQSGSPRDCYLNPSSLAAARLLGPANLVTARVEAGIAHSPFGAVTADMPDGPATMMIRPEGLRLAAQGAAVAVADVHFGGAFHEVTVEAEGVTAILRHTGPHVPATGPAHLVMDPDRVRLFPH
ncbi:ABC transporter ATP-binding protein [Sphingosinicella sp. CPCC 101087]|uniref:ABC transporter ATP-binding protein n=1 Tax=Sphingosinicella sp. CPCC 101087 TaxID=2497754 RepID=UPI00101C533A|nr:ABC transporter ATP-binding protein [Sphingosinicella sp. CPCC 101087]